jgi:hypothetical protein
MLKSLRLHFVERYDEQWMINQEGYGSNPEICQQKQMLGSWSTRFSKYIPDFTGFKSSVPVSCKIWLGTPQVLEFSYVIKIRHF